MKYVTLLCILPIFIGSASANELQSALTLEMALQYGAENNPQIQAAYYQWKGVEESIAVQKSLPDPVLSYGYYFESVETRVGPQNQRFGLSQTFPGFGKQSLKKSIATDLASAFGERYQQAKLNLDALITEAYAELYYLKRSIDITRDRITLIQELEKVALTRYKTGAPLASCLQAQIELGRLEDRLSSLTDQRGSKVARLNAALNRSSKAPLSWPTDLPYIQIDLDEEMVLKNLQETSPELAALSHRIEQESHRVQLAKRNRLPDFTIGVQYIETGNSDMPVANSGQDAIIGTIGINLPLWFEKNRAHIATAHYQKTAAELTFENHAQTLESDIQQALFNLRDAGRKINLYKESLIPKAQQSLEVNRTAYESGAVEFINLIDAERMLLEFELSYERALADHLISRATLSKLTGTDFITGESHETP